jgi:predicted nucleic acid-binding protein
LERFKEHGLSFHDALVAAVMKRLGIYRAFAFDRHFWLFGFEVLPGRTR